MPSKNKGKQKRHRQGKGNAKGRKESQRGALHNFFPEAGPGCHIAHGGSADWILGSEEFDPDDYDEDVCIPDIAIDPSSNNQLSVINKHRSERVSYVSVYECPVLDRKGVVLQQGSTTDNDGVTHQCTTLIMLLPPLCMLHLGFLGITPETSSAGDVRIESDFSEWSQHMAPTDEHTMAVAFPLGGNGPYLCTQGEGGSLTHFFSGNLHAIDFRCDVGTPLVAVADGVVVECQDSNTLTGISVNNLFKWNSIMLQLDDEAADNPDAADAAVSEPGVPCGGPLFVEYVHIQAGSCCVKPGDRVKAGQQICCSGSVGFSPEPHLHFTAFRSREDTAPTVRVRFRGSDGPYIPIAGKWYAADGIAPSSQS